MSNILDRVLESQERSQKESLNPIELTSQVLKFSNEREQEILRRRYGLLREKEETLEEIGKSYGLTRERIRQLEQAAINRIKAHDEFKKDIISSIEGLTISILEKHGGIMEHRHLATLLLPPGLNYADHINHLNFLLSKLLDQSIEKVIQKTDINPAWKIANMDVSASLSLVQSIVELLSRLGNPVTEDELFDKILSGDTSHTRQHVEAAMNIASNVKKNIFGKWGLKHWPHISPRRMADKIYLVFNEVQKPLHFEEITNLINQYNFDHKSAHTPTVHNELILDDRFVLIGRGLYALKEWGYKDGVVKDLIATILNEKGPLSKNEILEVVRPQRVIKDSTILLALSDKSRFLKHEDGRYTPVI